MCAFYSNFPAYESIEDLRIKNHRNKITYIKKHPKAQPVELTGKLGVTWWGKSWNKNLERYADFDNRLGRGKRYIKAEAIYDLQIKEGEITAAVAGSGKKVYNIQIQIDPISKADGDRIIKRSSTSIETMEDLLQGKFTKDMQEVFFQQGHGLFPEPKQIHIDCSCPDYARLCKHVAATLYGVSVKLDENPALLFTLRSMRMDDLIAKALGENMNQLLQSADEKSNRDLEDDEDLIALFHLD